MTTKTVLVTGATGYIAKHLVLQLLEAGHSVVGSARTVSREDELRAALAGHVSDQTALERLRVVALDLTKDDGWDAAMDGVDVMMHTASPFPMDLPKNEDDVIRPAVDGALRAVKAAKAAGVARVIMTSSTVAISNTSLPEGRSTYDETDWSDLSGPAATAYVKSKTMAERAIWDWQADTAPEMQITMINPTFVQGPPLDTNYGTSIQLVERLMKGKDPMLPNLGFACVDVRDIAQMHIRAMNTPASVGKRMIGVGRFIWMAEMAALLKKDHPTHKIALRTAPNLMMRLLALFDPAIRSVLPMLGKEENVSNALAREILGMKFRDISQSIRDTGDYLVDHKLV